MPVRYMKAFQTLLQQAQEEVERWQKERSQEREEAEKRQDEKRKQEADKTDALFETMQKQLEEHTTAELGLLHGDVGELRG